MKKAIAYMRLTGILSFIAYLFFVGLRQQHNMYATLTAIIGIACFAVVFILQLYRFYILDYLRREEDKP